MDEKGPKQPPNPIINFQYYPPPRPQKEMMRGPDPTTFMPVYAPNPFMPPQMGYTYQHPFLPTPSFPIVKHYEINAGGPNGNHETMNIIYEDVLPAKPLSGSLNTLSERLTIYNFIRSVIFSNSDGTDISLSGEGNSILSHVRMDELNPYNTYKFSLNPYKGMPDDFLIYRSCYPIRHNESGGNVICAKDSTGVNIRLYKMTEGSFIVNRNNKKSFPEYNEWREIAYYEFLREQVMKNKLSPNFVNMFGYFIAEKSGVNFVKINEMRNRKSAGPVEPAMIRVDSSGVRLGPDGKPFVVKKPEDDVTIIDDVKFEPIGEIFGPHTDITTKKIKYVNSDNQIIETNPDAWLGKALVLMTESPTYNLFGWASKTYQIDGKIKRMINRGMHTDREWLGILFQLMSALYVMQIKGICIDKFSVEHNVFIKDLTLRGPVTNFWKYKIDNIDYYIPNDGYLVMIDSNFADRKDQTDSTTLLGSTAQQQNFKLDGDFMGKFCTLNKAQKEERTFDMFLRAMDSNVYSSDFIATGGCRPPEAIIRMMDEIITSAKTPGSSKNIGSYIIKHLNKFLHNRVGTYLKEGEIANIRREDKREFVKGQLAVYEDGYGSFKFVLYLSVESGNATVLTRPENKTNPEIPDYIEASYPITELHNYSKAEPILQTFKPNESSMNEDDLLETYVIFKE
jgi:hypothetical protein